MEREHTEERSHGPMEIPNLCGSHGKVPKSVVSCLSALDVFCVSRAQHRTGEVTLVMVCDQTLGPTAFS